MDRLERVRVARMRYSTAREARKRSLKESSGEEGYVMMYKESRARGGYMYELRELNGRKIAHGNAKDSEEAVEAMMEDIRYFMYT